MTRGILRASAAALLVMLLATPGRAGALRLDGDAIQGGLINGHADPGARVLFNGKPVRVSPQGQFVIGFGRTAPPKATVAVTFADGRSETKVINVEQREYDVQRIDGLPPRKVTPTAEDLKRIRAENALIAKARRRDTPDPYFASGFIWPVTGIITGVYGSQRILNGQPRQPHYGIDIAAPTGTEVVAPADGVVGLAYADMFFSGNTIIIDHGHGLTSAFLHLDEMLVRDGDRVVQGQLIGRVGATGRVTGAHLDWRVNLFNTRLDPALIAGPMPPLPANRS